MEDDGAILIYWKAPSSVDVLAGIPVPVGLLGRVHSLIGACVWCFCPVTRLLSLSVTFRHHCLMSCFGRSGRFGVLAALPRSKQCLPDLLCPSRVASVPPQLSSASADLLHSLDPAWSDVLWPSMCVPGCCGVGALHLSSPPSRLCSNHHLIRSAIPQFRPVAVCVGCPGPGSSSCCHLQGAWFGPLDAFTGEGLVCRLKSFIVVILVPLFSGG